MHALVLAAGVGSRLRPYTDDRPKPMLEVGGRPIIAFNLAMLAAAGFRDVVVNLHHLPNVIRDYVGTGERWNLRVTFSEEPDLLGTAGALLPFRERLSKGTFAIVYGDNVNDLDLGVMRAFHEAHDATATIALVERADVSQSGVAEVSSSGRISRFIEKPKVGQTTSHLINAGALVVSPAFLQHVPDDRPSDIGRDVLPELVQERSAYGFVMRGEHWWFDRVADYESGRDDRRLIEMAALLPN